MWDEIGGFFSDVGGWFSDVFGGGSSIAASNVDASSLPSDTVFGAGIYGGDMGFESASVTPIADSGSGWWGMVNDIFGDGFGKSLLGMGQSLMGQQATEFQQGQLDFWNAQLAQNKELELAKIAASERMAAAAAGAQVAAANIAAGAANKRAKLAAIMDASGRRIDANTVGTNQKLSAIQEMIRAAGRKY